MYLPSHSHQLMSTSWQESAIYFCLEIILVKFILFVSIIDVSNHMQNVFFFVAFGGAENARPEIAGPENHVFCFWNINDDVLTQCLRYNTFTFIHHEGSTKQRKKHTKFIEDRDRRKDRDKTQDKLSKQTTHIKHYHRN